MDPDSTVVTALVEEEIKHLLLRRTGPSKDAWISSSTGTATTVLSGITFLRK